MNSPHGKLNIHHAFASLDNRLSYSLSAAQIFFIFSAIDFPYQYGFRFLDLFDSITLTLVDAMLFTSILWITTRLDLARVTLAFLALPYLVFIPGWLNIPTAAILLIIFLYCIANTLRTTISAKNKFITLHDVFAFILIIIWVNLSGAGGYGHQTPDYQIHNARLKDLIDHTWPVQYGVDKNFVYYFGYFLPAAIIGKLSNTDIAFNSLYPWTLLGVTLALRWLSLLSGWRFSAFLAVIFIFFGPLDILNVLALDYHANIPIKTTITTLSTNTDWLDFRTQNSLGFFIGNYPSNTFQLFWSPHQVIAGWLCISLLTFLFLRKQTRHIVFIYALLCLWSPLIMLALAPFVILTIFWQLSDKKWREVITMENFLGAGTLILVFIIFYWSGSPETIPSPFIFNHFDWAAKSGALVLFYFSAWGLFVATQIPYLINHSSTSRFWFMCLTIVLLLLPLKQFGAYSDLLCRGSAPLMFLLLVFILQSIPYYRQQKKQGLLILLFSLIVLGSGSALLQLRVAIDHYGQKAAIGNIIGYRYANENLGPDNTLFNRWLRRSPPPSNLP